MLYFLVALAALCAIVPGVLFLVNSQRLQAPRFGPSEDVRIAVLIAARDEEAGIQECLKCVLASREADFHIFVLDDHSVDRTAEIVLDIAAVDARLDLLQPDGLPAGWNSKEYACWQLAQATNAPLLLFLDADVRLDPWALARSIAAFRAGRVALLSGFPRQRMAGAMDWLVLPLMHFLLLGFFSLKRMRKTTAPAYAAGCGQFLLADRKAYFNTGGHSAICETRKDGLGLPRLFRGHGYRTDIVDLTNLASMGTDETPQVLWQGMGKNATEGLGLPGRILPFTLLLALGQIAPFVLLPLTLFVTVKLSLSHAAAPVLHVANPLLAALLVCCAGVAVLACWVPRLLACRRFKQPWKSAWLHPVGVALLLSIQWYAVLRQAVGRPLGWRARNYSTTTGAEV